jgi:Tfp pilus assembly protein PilE
MKNIFNKAKTFLNQTGFTVMELIIVIAIMAILSTIIAVNVKSYLLKGREAAIKGNMHSIASGATVFFDSEKKWNNVFNRVNNPSIFSAMDAINKATAPNIVSYALKSDNSSWCVCSPLLQAVMIISNSSPVNTYCVDSSGYRKETNAFCYSRCGSATGLCLD